MCFFQGESYKKGKEQGRKDERERIVGSIEDLNRLVVGTGLFVNKAELLKRIEQKAGSDG